MSISNDKKLCDIFFYLNINFMNFFKANWKTILYPGMVMLIIIFDQIVGISYLVTLIKIFVFSIIHVFYVKKTKYIYDSEVYRHYAELRSEYENNFTLEYIIPEKTKRVLFIIIYSLSLFLCIISNNIFSGKGQLGLVLCILCIIFIIDVFYEFVRTFTNTTNFSKVNAKLPLSIRVCSVQKRYMYTFLMQKLVQHGPTCINAVKGVAAGVGVMEIGYATAFEISECGPLTKYVANEYVYKANELDYPIYSRQDLIYEGQRKNILEGVIDGSRAYCDMPKRTFSFCSELERNEFLLKNRIVK